MCEACYVLLGQTVFPVNPSLNPMPGTFLPEEKGETEAREKWTSPSSKEGGRRDKGTHANFRNGPPTNGSSTVQYSFRNASG